MSVGTFRLICTDQLQIIATKILGGTAEPAASIEASLKRLDLGSYLTPTFSHVFRVLPLIHTGYVDLYLIHSPHGGKEARLKIWKALLDAKAQGKARDVGVSNLYVSPELCILHGCLLTSL